MKSKEGLEATRSKVNGVVSEKMRTFISKFQSLSYKARVSCHFFYATGSWPRRKSLTTAGDTGATSLQRHAERPQCK